MKQIALVNTPECPCPYTHFAACTEFIRGFADYGYTVCEVKHKNEVVDKDILLLSSHKIDINYLETLNALNPDAVYILWYYHNVIDRIPFKKWILTGEHFYNPPRIPEHIRYHNINRSIPNFVPLLLRADEAPEKVGSYPKEIKYNGCFMGTPYCPDWVNGLPNVVYHSIHSGGLLTYEQRRDIHLQSIIGFGFMSNENILNNHVTQRVFEALCYGCVLLSNSPTASEMTNGIVEYVDSKQRFQERFHYYLQHPEEVEQKRKAGYEWARQFGTNRYAAKLFLDKIDELWT
jgi:hypothetical protein